MSSLFQPLVDVIRMKLIPGLTDRSPANDEERNLLSLAARHGGIALSNPTADTDPAFSASTTLLLVH